MAYETIQGKHKILIAEYKGGIRKRLADTFREQGQEVIEVNSREMTLSVIEKEEPEIILLDADYPVMSGVGVLAWIRMNPLYRRIPVLLIHRENATDAEIFAGFSKGVNCSPVEPIVPSEVVNYISRILTPPTDLTDTLAG